MQHRQESAARQGMGLFLWPCVLSQQNNRGILTSSDLRIKLREYLWQLHAHTRVKMHKKPSQALRKILNKSTHKYPCLHACSVSLCMSIFTCLCVYVCVCIPHCSFSTAELLSVKRQNSLPDRIWFPVSSVTTFLSNTPYTHTSMFFFYHDGDFPLTVCTELLICLTLTETFLDFNFSLRHYLVFYLTRHCLVSTMISSCYNPYECIWFPQHRQNVTHPCIILYYIISPHRSHG